MAVQDPSTGVFITLAIVLFLPAIIMIIGGTFLIRDGKQHKLNAGQPAQDSNHKTVTKTSTRVTNINVNFGFGDDDSKNENDIDKGPLSVDCPSCGAKVTVQHGDAASCEYCGALVK